MNMSLTLLNCTMWQTVCDHVYNCKVCEKTGYIQITIFSGLIMEVMHFFVIDCKPIVMHVYVLGILKINIVVGDVSES